MITHPFELLVEHQGELFVEHASGYASPYMAVPPVLLTGEHWENEQAGEGTAVAYTFNLSCVPDAQWRALFNEHAEGVTATFRDDELTMFTPVGNFDDLLDRVRQLIDATNDEYQQEKQRVLQRVTAGQKQKTSAPPAVPLQPGTILE